MKNIDWKKLAPYLGVIAFFFAITIAYFTPQLSGKVLDTHDQKQWAGGAQESIKFYEETGELPLWTNSKFGGMPAYYAYMKYPSNFFRNNAFRDIFALGLDRPISYILTALVCFFILTLTLKIKPLIGAVGSIGYAFSSYLFVITAAGHFAKTSALSYLPGLIAGLILIYNWRKYLLGAAFTALVFALELVASHPQMTYYFAIFFILPFVVYEFICAIKSKELKHFFISSLVAGGALLAGVLPNASQLMVTQEYAPYSTRGSSELTLKGDDQTNGLDKSYILGWSNGIGETWSLMIPNAKGGASGVIAENDKAMDAVDSRFRQAMSGVDQYWGDQPFTGGPMYSGAIIIFLFVFGLLAIRSKFKWVIVFSTVVTIMLSWGSNFMALSDFFIDNFPLYSKFRAVASIQTVAHFCIPLMGVLLLKEISDEENFFDKKISLFDKESKFSNLQALYAAFALTGGLALLFAIMPTTFFEFFKTGEVERYMGQLKGAGWSAGDMNNLLDNIEAARVAIFTADAWRSFFFILVGAVIIFLYAKKKMSLNILVGALAILVLVDLWTVDKAYLNDDNFVSESKVDVPFPKTPANDFILKDSDPDFRVLNVSVSTFNESSTSAWHKSLGDYSGVKMKNYQEMVEYHISKEINQLRSGLGQARTMADVNNILKNTQVINALNTKYIIVNPQNQPLINSQAFGNAWFVKDLKVVETADDEILGINDVDLSKTALIRSNQTTGVPATSFDVGKITLTDYKPNALQYTSENSADGFAVFSEIYYPIGWNVTIDGESVEMKKVDYFLRGLYIPKGKHTIKFEFKPTSYYTGEKIALAGSVIILLLIAGSIFQWVKGLKADA